MNYKIDKKENLYFALKVVFTFLVLYFLFDLLSQIDFSRLFVVIFPYVFFIWLFIVFQKIFLIGYLKGNGVEISEEQFSDVYVNYVEMGKKLKLRKLPKLFVVQEGGLLNAFAVRFSGRHYIAIYAEIFSLFETEDSLVNFVLGHEMGHVKRNHLMKRFWTFPSLIVPFLDAAYSRSCEYTCDNIRHALSPEGSIEGMVLLAGGKDIFRKIDVDRYVKNARENSTLVVKFAGLFMSHPYLPKRIENIRYMK